MAVGTGARVWHRSINFSYFPVPVAADCIRSLSCLSPRGSSGRRSRLFQNKSEDGCDDDAEKKRPDCRLKIRALQLRGAARSAHQHPAEHRAQQRAEGEIKKVDDAGCRAAELR